MKPPPGRVEQPAAGFVDGQQMGVFKQDFEVLRESGSIHGGRFQTRVLALK